MSRDSAASYRRSTIVFSLIQDDSLMRICECRYYPRFVFTTFTYATADTETDTRTRRASTRHRGGAAPTHRYSPPTPHRTRELDARAMPRALRW